MKITFECSDEETKAYLEAEVSMSHEGTEALKFVTDKLATAAQAFVVAAATRPRTEVVRETIERPAPKKAPSSAS